MTTVAPSALGPLAQADQPAARADRAGCRDRSRCRRRGPRRGSGCSRTVQRVAPAVPDHVGDALADGPGEQLAQVGGHVVGRVRQLGLDLGRRQRRAGAGQLTGQGQLAVALHGAAHVGQRVAGEPLEVGELGPGPLRVDVEQPVGQLGLDGDHGQRVAEDVVQVAGEPGALVLDGERGVLLVGPHQVDVARHHLPDAEHGDATRPRPRRRCRPGCPSRQGGPEQRRPRRRPARTSGTAIAQREAASPRRRRM